MALIVSTLNFKQHPSLTFHSLIHNNSKTRTLCLINSNLHISKCSLSNGFTPNYPNHHHHHRLNQCIPLIEPNYPNPNSKYYLENPSKTHNNINKRNIWVKTSTIPVPELESKSHRIWWSDVVVNNPKNVFGRKYKKWNYLDIVNICYMGGMHLLALFATFTFTWERFLVGLVIGLVTGWLGITLSYHRNLAHRSFKLPKWLEYLFAYCGVLAFQGDPISWVNIHRYHHKYCDTEKDPHTPKKGFWFSHINWIFDTKAITNSGMPNSESVDNAKTQELEGITIPHMPRPSMNSLIALPKFGDTNNVEDLEKQPFYRFIRSTYILHSLLLGLLLYGLGGYPYLVWGMGVRSICAYHITFLVNSAAHVWGYQSWNTGDLSKNNWWVALLTSGEGWHNNHHAFPYSAKHGMEWWQIDLTWYAIKLLQVLGLATHVKLPTQPHKTRLAFKHKSTQLAQGIK